MAKKTKMIERNKINLISSALIIFIGIGILLLSLFNINKPLIILYGSLFLISIIKFVEYLKTNNGTDYEDLYIAFSSLFIFLSSFIFFKSKSELVISLTVMSWVSLISITRLIKIDYYHDRDNGMFYVKFIASILFLIIGIISSFNLFYGIKFQTIVIGYLITTYGILNLSEDSLRTFVSKNSIKIKDTK